jgi:hypothetical protein
MASELLFDQHSGRFAGPEAGDAHPRREALIGLLYCLGLLIVVNFNLELDLTLRQRFGRYFHLFSSSIRRGYTATAGLGLIAEL